MGRRADKSSKKGRKDNRVRGMPQRTEVDGDQQSIREWLKQVRFRKTIFGGVVESDVWKKIAELNAMYEQALAAERVRYDALLKERAETMAEQLVAQKMAEEAGQEMSGDDVRYE